MRQTGFQLWRFLAVGGGATAMHVAVALAGHTSAGLSPLWSNFIAFLVALAVSYCGHRLWTFRSTVNHGFAMPRFLVLALAGFSINHAIVYLATGQLGLPLWLALAPAVSVVPLLTFWLSRVWIFLPRRHEA
jgi:putative flippase GtrA